MLGSLKHPAYLKAVKFEHDGAGGSLRFTSKTTMSALTTERSANAEASMSLTGVSIVSGALKGSLGTIQLLSQCLAEEMNAL